MKKSKEGPQFTELPFSEDSESDDEDYDPARDELNVSNVRTGYEFRNKLFWYCKAKN